MGNTATTFSETVVDEWVRAGVRHAVISPGSRSTPLALALAARAELRCHIVLDERVAGFLALGAGLADGHPAVVLTTSGTAVTHLHAAVVEADLSEIPLIVCSADRPPELYDVGAAQTIDQRRIFGHAVRAYLDLGPPEQANRAAWRSLAARAVAEATGTPAGPVQVNCSFREPLVGPPGPLPAGRPDGRPWHRRVVAPAVPDPVFAEETARRWVGRRGVIVAGAGIGEPAAVLALGRRLGWPVLADPRSGCRTDDDVVVAHADAILRVADVAAALRPEVLVQLGAPHASKVLAGWAAQAARAPGDLDGDGDGGAESVVVNRAGSWWDPDRRADLVVACSPEAFAGAVERCLVDVAPPGPSAGGDWLAAWRRADDLAATVLDRALRATAADGPPTEPAVARSVAAAAARHGAAAVVVSSSMPVRDLEWYAPRVAVPADGRSAPRVFSNRGANGIDGVVATALGVAATTAPDPVWVLIGDLAFLHDANALLDAADRPVRLRLVVVDNAGGGIFSFLPQASVVQPDRFEQLFGTAQQADPAGMLAVHGIPVAVVDRADVLEDAVDELARTEAAVAALVVRTGDRQGNVTVHERLHAAVAAALADG